MTLFNKIKWILGIAMVFVLILATNLIDRQNFIIIEASIETIYADRIIAQNIIYDISKEVAQKEINYGQFSSDQIAGRNSSIDSRIEDYLKLFAETKLTANEEIYFGRLKQSLRDLIEAETASMTNQGDFTLVSDGFRAVRNNLDELANIQVQEGKRELYESRKALGSANLFTQLEIAALIFMAVLIQVIILYSPKVNLDA